MPNAISMLLVLAVLVPLTACTHPEPLDAWSGILELSLCGSDADGEAPPPLVSITRLDEPFDTRSVALPPERGRVLVELSAGLYAVDGAPGSSAPGAVDAVMPVLSQPALVIVAPGQMSTVYVHAAQAANPGALRVAAIGGL